MNPNIEPLLARLGLSLTSHGPIPIVKDDWPVMRYDCTLTRNGREVWHGDYSLGVGHAKPLPKNPDSYVWNNRLTNNEHAFLLSWSNNPNANFRDKELWSRVACKVASHNKVTPTLPDVLNCLLSDGSAHFDNHTFETWCSDFGYDTDSRKAEAIFNECVNTGRDLARAFTPAELAELREAFSQY